MIQRGHIEEKAGRSRRGIAWLTLVLLSLAGSLGATSEARADACSDFGGVLDGAQGDVAPSQIQVDQNCTIRNFPASNPLSTNFSFFTQPGQNPARWLIVFDNVVHTGQMSCNSVLEHKIWFTNGSSTSIQEGCQNLLIPVEKIDKKNPVGQTTATVGVPFTYTLTLPVLFDSGTGTVIDDTGSLNELHSVTLTDDLNATGAALSYLSHVAYWKNGGAPVPHTFSNSGGLLTFDDFPIIPAQEQILIEITVVLDDSPTNVVGTQFVNTAKWEFGRLIDDVFYEPLPGEWGISDPLTIAAPELIVTKTGPATLGRTLNLGEFGQFGVDVHNTGLSDAWNVTILDRLPDGPTGGTCNLTPEVLSAQIFESNGSTPVSGVLVEGSDFAVSYAPAPTCELTITLLSPETVIGPDQRLILSYQTQLDSDSQDGATLTNVVGAVQWFNGDASDNSRLAFTRPLTNGTVTEDDHEDAHTVTVALFGYFFEKSVQNLTSGANPASTAGPGDVLRYTLRLQATDVALDNLTFFDDLGELNAGTVFVPGSLAIVAGSLPAGADAANTNPNGGTNGQGILDVRDLAVPVASEVSIQFDITVDPGAADGTVILNQADLLRNGKIADSDDPNLNGQADPNVPGDEDPTRVVVATVPAGPLVKVNTQATAAVGETFGYLITIPGATLPYPLYDVRIVDALAMSDADLRFVGVSKVSGPGSWTPVNTGTGTNVVIEDTTSGIDIPVGGQIVVEIRVVLEDTTANVAGLPFTNTATYLFDRIDDDETSAEPGQAGTTAPMTIVEPELTLAKGGPATMTIGTPETFTLDVENVGDTPAWNATLVDRLPDGPTGGTCDTAPASVVAQVFDTDGSTPVSGVLVEDSDYSLDFSGAAECLFTLSVLSDQGTIGPGQHLRVSYETQLDLDTQDGVALTNVAGAVEWFSFDSSSADRRTYTEVIDQGSVGIVDHEDAHTVGVSLPGVLFEKTVVNVTRGGIPATSASPGDVLRYRLRVESLSDIPLDDFGVRDDLGSLNALPVFVPGSLGQLVAPFGAVVTGTDPNGGTNGAGQVEVLGLGLAALNDSVVIEFEVTLAAVIPNGTRVTNQSQLTVDGGTFLLSDDPTVNGSALPDVVGDEDPTEVPIESAPAFLFEKISTDLTGDPNVLLAGETLRYELAVSNVGSDVANEVVLRDQLPVNTTYVPGSTTLNGAPVTDGAGGLSPLAAGILLNAPSDPSPGVLAADPSGDPSNVATVRFEVVVDANAIDGTIISNQGFVTSVPGGVVDGPSDDPRTPAPNDPTRNIVGDLPLLFAAKDVALLDDRGSLGVVDPGDSLRYTITVSNSGSTPALGVSLRDDVPANTSYMEDTTTLNGDAVGRPDGSLSPLAGGIPISSNDLTPPVPGFGEGMISPGESAVVTFDLLVDSLALPGTIISNQATISTERTPILLTDGDGNPSTGPEPTVVVVGDAQLLSITKQVSVVGGGAVLAGSTLEYVVRVENIAAVPAYGVVISDDLDAPVGGQLSYVDVSATLNGGTAGVMVTGSIIEADYSALSDPLQPGEVAVLRFRAVTDSGLAMGTSVTNTGVVTWGDPAQMASASVTVDIGGTPGVGVLNGTLWHDADFDGVQAVGERALAGWTVELYRSGQLVQSIDSDAAGAYTIGGLPPNDVSGESYELRFQAPGAGVDTAALGVADSPFTNGPQRISDIVVASGANLQGLNLPIEPNGVVYGALPRTPVAGARVTLLDPASEAPVPASCFDDPVQQGQVTSAEGYYKFDLNFLDGACPVGGSYLIAVTPPGSGFSSGVSQIIPPSSDRSTPAFSVPICPGGPGDAVPATARHCEAQASEFAPASTIPIGGETAYHLHLTLDDSQVPGSSQIFNNHIPLDPVLGAAVSISKTTPKVTVSRGDLVPYKITVHNQLGAAIPSLGIVDTFPAGFRYVKGSARVDGVPSEPLVDGNALAWNGVGVEAAAIRKVDLLLAVGAGVSEGEYTNQAQAVDTPSGTPVSALALATVQVVPDPTFSCTDVIGKVFDDRNRDGIQGAGEKGLAGIRVVTPRGLKARTDAHGRYHITCAAVPREDRGSNFVLKLDDRTLPSGFRATTPTVQVKRATQGKALRFNFGAALHRVVGLDLVDAAFEPGTSEMRPQWTPRVDLLLEELEKSPSILRLSYVAEVEDPDLVEERVDAIKERITRAWEERAAYTLTIETEIFWRRGTPKPGPFLGIFERSAVDTLPPVGAGPPVVESEAGEAAERHLPIDEPFTRWTQDPERLDVELGDRLEEREVLTERPETVRLRNVIPPIRFGSGDADIPVSYVERLRGIMDSMQHLHDVRLHLVGHADDQRLSPELTAIYVDNEGLSRERAGEVAVHLMDALGLSPESISFEWAGASHPIASNASEAGRALNRRVEVEVWYDEIREEPSVEDVVVSEEIKRVKVCRTETVCKLRYREGHAHRARLRNLIPPLHFDDDTFAVPPDFVAKISEALDNLRDKQNVTVKLIAFTDDLPLTGRAERIYGTHLSFSKARSRRVAQAVQDALGLRNAAIESDGRGAARPIASNDTAQGRALNRRIEVEFWHDDPLQELPGEPQPCPDAADAELVTRVYDPPWGRIEPLAVEGGEIRVPEGYGDDLARALSEVAHERNARLRFVGYTRNERLDRRTALVYGDDIGLSADRARRAMEQIRAALDLSEAEAEHEGRGFVHSNDVVNGGFIQGETDHVEVQVVYDELALLDDYEGVAVTPITRELAPQDPLALNLMRITVDGEPIDDPGRSLADVQRCTDVALERANVRFRFDDLESTPRLSVSAEPTAVPFAPASVADATGPLVRFRMYTNYPHFIERSEVRIFPRQASVDSEPLAVVEVGPDGLARWQVDSVRFEAPLRELAFVLRAYDAEGRFDETAPQTLWLIHGDPASESAGPLAEDPPVLDPAVGQALLAGYGESEPVARNIPLGNAGTVTVDGSAIPPGHTVWVAGAPVPVDAQGRFVAETVLPAGMHTVEVAVIDEEGNGELFLRDLEFEESDWFYVAIADLTVSDGYTSGPAGALEGKDAPYDRSSNVDGRLAFYVNGKFGEDWQLTASADTREEPVEDLFTNFTDKSTDALLRRIDPDYYYPTFGDDSTVEETAPTLGKFYVKLSKAESHVLWGNFKASYLDNELAQIDRGLYGANLHYETPATTSFGEQRLVIDGFGADPGTVSSRDEFRGTGGSLYFLQRQDLMVGSERVRIETRDKDSGLVTGVVPLRYGLDYDIDYIQGRIVLTEPLSSVADDARLVRSGGLSGNETYLVVRYEYTPGINEIDTLVAGGQAQAWLADFLALGLTANRNEEDGVDSTLYGTQLTLRATDRSWLKLQAGRSEGPVSASVVSKDGGFTFTPDGGQDIPQSDDAFAYRMDASLGIGDVIDGADGRLGFYFQRLEENYSAPGQNAFTDTDQVGGFLEVPVTEWLRFTAKADWMKQDGALETRTEEVDVDYGISDRWNLGAGVRNDTRDDDSAVVAATQKLGDRTDAVVQLGYDSQDRWRAYLFGQATLRATGDRDQNNRGGVGGAFRISEQLSLNGEVSHGDQGLAAQVGTTYQRSEQTSLYLTYALENERALNGGHARNGNLVAGARTRFSDSGSVYVENRYQHASTAGLTQAVGMDFALTDWLSLGASWENGELRDRQTQAETKRRAGSATVGYRFGDLLASSGVEYRFDDIEQPDGTSSDRTTWLFRNDLKIQLSPDWRLLGKYNLAMSDSSLGSFFDGGYTEGVVGFAYRPVEHDRLNVLAKYTFFQDVPTTDQLSVNGSPAEYIQRSHIASVDATYDLFPSWLTIGAKYAFRRGEVSLDRDDTDYFSNDAHLYVLRGDLRVLTNWELSAEGRLLHLPDLKERRSGALVTVYRYLGEHLKVGVGYNFTDFSDDLTDLSYDHQGWFFNIVGTL